METINLSQIGLYNPQRMNDEVVASLFVVRKKLFDLLLKKVISETDNTIPQHYLIIGQRGMGKTTLLKRMEVQLRKEYAKNFIPLLFPEEQYNIDNLGVFWLNALDALADTLEVENNNATVVAIDNEVRQIAKEKDSNELSRKAYNALIRESEKIGRRPVLLLDNISLIFERLSKAEQHLLRAQLMKNGAPILVGASVVSLDETNDYGAPFYDAFQYYYLKKLSFEELMLILQNLAKVTNTEQLLPSINQELARLKTIHQLTGGNPRTAVMLFKLIVKGFTSDVNDDLEALLDEITPLYKARFEELPQKMQIIVDAIALAWKPVDLAQLREETKMENPQLSPQLKRLVDSGWIEKITTDNTAASSYQISERFFNIWFLMRRSSRRQKQQLQYLAKFLESLYGDELPTVASKRLDKEIKGISDVTYNLALCEVIRDEELKSSLEQKSYKDLSGIAELNPNMVKESGFYKDDGFIVSQTLQILDLMKISEWHKADRIIEDLYDENPSDLILTHLLAEIKGNLAQYTEAEALYQKAISLDEKNASPWIGLGHLYQVNLKQYDKAEQAYQKAISLDEKNANLWNYLGILYQENLKQYDKAEQVYLKAISLDETDAAPWNNLGILYQENLKQYDKAEQAYQKAISLDETYATPWYGLGNLYQGNLKQYDKAEQAYEKAISLDGTYVGSWNGLGNLYQDYLKQYNKAEEAYTKAIALNPYEVIPKYNLIFLYRDKWQQIEKALKLFDQLNPEEGVADSYWLNAALFDLYAKNEGLAIEKFNKALESIKKELPTNTQDDWWRFAAVVNKLGYTPWLTKALEESGYDVILSPFYYANKALKATNREGYLNSIVAEIRDVAKIVIEKIEHFQ